VGEDWFETVLHIQTPLSRSLTTFYLTLFNSVTKRKLIVKYKKYWKGHSSPLASHPRYAYDSMVMLYPTRVNCLKSETWLNNIQKFSSSSPQGLTLSQQCWWKFKPSGMCHCSVPKTQWLLYHQMTWHSIPQHLNLCTASLLQRPNWFLLYYKTITVDSDNQTLKSVHSVEFIVTRILNESVSHN
jgi:hypothetical protein